MAPRSELRRILAGIRERERRRKGRRGKNANSEAVGRGTPGRFYGCAGAGFFVGSDEGGIVRREGLGFF